MSAAPPGPCDVCGRALARYRHVWLWRCAACRTLRSTFPVAIPHEAGGDALDEALRESGLAAVRTRNNAWLLAALKARSFEGARLLDVGSGPGFLLDAARAEGFQPEGIEPDANTVAAAAARGAPVRHGYFPDALEPGERFDVIVFNDVIEHIPDLAAALKACADHLTPGGLLCLNCPDRRGLFFRTADLLDRLGLGGAYDRLWQRDMPSPHIWYFTPEGLTRAAARHGFAPETEVALASIDPQGLWSRIRYVKGQSILLSAAAWLFALAAYPATAVWPDSVACIFRARRG